jgi:hypothetical protein
MLISTSAPSTGFTLSSSSLEQPTTTAGVEHVWWDRWGRWHPDIWGWPRPVYGYGWGWPRLVYGYGYYGPVRHCWVGPWGGMHCRFG